MKSTITAWLAGMLLLIAGCGGTSEQPSRENQDSASEPVIAFVAASTRDAVQEIAAAFTRQTSVEVKINADDSSKLATQIVHDAPAHVFLSANEKWADFVKEKGFAKKTVPLLGNSLVIVVPRGNPAGIKRPADLTGPEVERVAIAGPTVPAGIYARQALKKLNLWDVLENDKRLVSGENVRVALAYVERGEARAGIVYSTDAKISDKVMVAYSFSPQVHDPIRYPLVLLKEGQKIAAGRAFFDFLGSPAALEVFKNHGFTILEGQ